MIKTTFLKITTACIFIMFAINTFASETDSLPWSSPMSKFSDSLSGPIVRGIAIAAIVVAGAMMAFGEFGSATKRMLMIVLGLGVCLAASGWLNTLFNFSGSLIK